MTEETPKDNNVKATVEAVTGLVQAIPVYQDTLQPAAKQIGQSLELVSKTVNIALAPIKALVWGYEQIEVFITSRVSEKLKKVSPENIVTPSPQIAGPAVEALRYAGHEENLRELYANLLATAMDKETMSKAHPGYVDIIKNLTPDEAILLTAFVSEKQIPLIDIKATVSEADGGGYYVMYANFSQISKKVTLTNPILVPSYIDNLCRLGILEVPYGTHLTAPNIYDPLENDIDLNGLKKRITEQMKNEIQFERKIVRLTTFGSLFVNNVVVEK